MWHLRRESKQFTPKQLLDEAAVLLEAAASYEPDKPNFPGQLNCDEVLGKSEIFKKYHRWNDRKTRDAARSGQARV
jgi:hypothetical protein